MSIPASARGTVRDLDVRPVRGVLLVGLGDRWGELSTDGIPDGYVLAVDSTADCGLSWQPGGGSFASPAFTAFSLDVSGPLEVGASIASGSHTFTWTTSNSANVQANSVAIADTTGGTTLASGLANTGSDAISLSAITNASPATQTWTISATNTQHGDFSRTYSVAWQWRVYGGTSANPELTANQIKALADSSALQAGFAGTYPLSAGGYKYFCYPDSMGSVANFVDSNTGFPVSMATASDDAAYSHTANGWSYALVSVTNAQSVTTNYRVHRSQFTLGGALSLKVS